MDQLSPIQSDLKIIENEKGNIYHALKKNDLSFKGFGEAYFTSIKYGETKGWKKHLEMYMNLIVPIGEVCFYLHNENNGITKKYIIGKNFYKKLFVPPGLWVAFSGLSKNENLILNISNIEHNPLESLSAPLQQFSLEN